jgi:hypothetical protein
VSKASSPLPSPPEDPPEEEGEETVGRRRCVPTTRKGRSKSSRRVEASCAYSAGQDARLYGRPEARRYGGPPLRQSTILCSDKDGRLVMLVSQ